MNQAHPINQGMKEANTLTNMKLAEIVVEYGQSSGRLILLDYDGTIVEIKNNPSEVIPNQEVLTIIEQLAADERNTIAIITGRDREYISKWFGNMNVYLFAEHGAFYKVPSQNDWYASFEANQEWRSQLLPILEEYTAATPGSMVEQKASSIAWHYRNVDSSLAYSAAQELHSILEKNISSEMNIHLLKGKKVIEIKQKGNDKGSACHKMVKLKNFPFILSIGDDVTDEDMFRALPPFAYTFKVGYGLTKAKIKIEGPTEVVGLLKKLLNY